jgi:hypothetical protein
MSEPETTCGAELAASAEVPEAWSRLMAHVAVNLESHAEWVGTDTDASRREHDGLLAVAAAYRDMAASATRAAEAMRALRELPPAPHEPGRFGRAAFEAWLRAKIGLQRDLAKMLTRHADVAESALPVDHILPGEVH